MYEYELQTVLSATTASCCIGVEVRQPKYSCDDQQSIAFYWFFLTSHQLFEQGCKNTHTVTLPKSMFELQEKKLSDAEDIGAKQWRRKI